VSDRPGGPDPGGSCSDKFVGVENRGGARSGASAAAGPCPAPLPGPCFGGVCPDPGPGPGPGARAGARAGAAAGGHGMRHAEATLNDTASVLVALGSAVMMTARPWALGDLTLREPASGPRLKRDV
jgi:hypothetical protein